MPCTLAASQTAACASGLGKVRDPVMLLQLSTELSRELGVPQTPACDSGIAKIRDPIMLLQMIAQLACELNDAATPNLRSLSTDLFDAASTVRVTSAITPAANRLILVCVSSVGGVGADVSSITGCGLTWQKINTAQGGPVGATIASLWRSMGASPTPGSLTVTLTASTVAAIRVVEFSGVNTSGTFGSGAIQQNAAGVGTAAIDPAVNLAAFQANGKSTGFYVASRGAVGTNPFSGTQEAGWTKDTDTGATGAATIGMFIAVRNLTTDNSMIVTAAAAEWGIVGIEIIPP